MQTWSISELITNKISGEWGEEVNGSPGVKILRTTNFTNEGRLNLENVVLRKIKPELIKKKRLLQGDIIIEKSGGSPNQPVGRVVFFNESDDEYLCNNFTAVLRPAKKVYPKYLFFALFFLHQSKRTLKYQNKTTGILNLKLERYLDEERIPLPDYKVQKEIADILSQADKARQHRKATNALTDQFLQSTFLSLFGDPARNEKGWEVKTISSSGCKVQIGPFGTQLHAEDYVENGIPLINPMHIQDLRIKENPSYSISQEKYKELKNYHLLEGDVVMGRRGEMGRCAVVTNREAGWLCGTGSLFIRPSEQLNSTYLHSVISSDSMRKVLENNAQGVTMANLNQTIVNNLELPTPPLKLQQHFASIVAQTELLRQRQRAHAEELEIMFQGLLQRYFG